MHTCKWEDRTERQTGGGKREKTDWISQIKAMENTHTHIRSKSVSKKTMLLEQHTREGTAVSGRSSSRSSLFPSNIWQQRPCSIWQHTTLFYLLKLHPVRAYFLVQDTWNQTEYHNAQIIVRYDNPRPCVFGSSYVFIIRFWLACKMMNKFLIWRLLNKFLILIVACKC